MDGSAQIQLLDRVLTEYQLSEVARLPQTRAREGSDVVGSHVHRPQAGPRAKDKRKCQPFIECKAFKLSYFNGKYQKDVNSKACLTYFGSWSIASDTSVKLLFASFRVVILDERWDK